MLLPECRERIDIWAQVQADCWGQKILFIMSHPPCLVAGAGFCRGLLLLTQLSLLEPSFELCEAKLSSFVLGAAGMQVLLVPFCLCFRGGFGVLVLVVIFRVFLLLLSETLSFQAVNGWESRFVFFRCCWVAGSSLLLPMSSGFSWRARQSLVRN